MENGVLLQVFHWFLPADGEHWKRVAARAKEWREAGFTALWLPPMSKGVGGINDVGYGVYDLWDLGEFEQMYSKATKYGLKEDLHHAIDAAHEAGLQIYADIVLNHKDGGDGIEEFEAIEVAEDDRNHFIGEPQTVKAFTHFQFPNRNGKYSDFEWHWHHFAWVGHNLNDESGDVKVYRIKEPVWGSEISDEKGIFDFLLGCDIDHGDDEVRADLFAWGVWLAETTKIDGFRLDAIKHIRHSFYNDWLDVLREKTQKELPAIGEYWSSDVGDLTDYLERADGRMMLFDVPLHYKFHQASTEGNDYDLSTIFEGTLVSDVPMHAVTFVENHDSQPTCSLESSVEEWFKPLAYALILLRREGYPCVFLADYDGHEYESEGRHVQIVQHRMLIDAMLKARYAYNYGEQKDYFDHPNCIGWMRYGDDEHPGAMGVIMSSGDEGTKPMETGRPGAVFCDMTGHIEDEIIANEDGIAEFRCPAGKVSVWIQK
jgi:alpha-amylase